MFVLKNQDSMEAIALNYLKYKDVEQLDISFDFSNIYTFFDEDGYLKEELKDDEVSIEVSVLDPQDELNDGDCYSISVPILDFVQKEV